MSPPTDRPLLSRVLDSDKYTPLIGKQCVGTMRKALTRKITGFTCKALTSNCAHFKARDHPPTDSAYNTESANEDTLPQLYYYCWIFAFLRDLPLLAANIFMHVTNNSGTPPPRGWALHWRRRRWCCYFFPLSQILLFCTWLRFSATFRLYAFHSADTHHPRQNKRKP